MLVVVPIANIGTQTTDIHNTTDIGRSNTRKSGIYVNREKQILNSCYIQSHKDRSQVTIYFQSQYPNNQTNPVVQYFQF